MDGYAYHVGFEFTYYSNGNYRPNSAVYQTAKIKRPSDFPFFGEAYNMASKLANYSYSTGTDNLISLHHGDRTNLGMADGSVTAKGRADIRELALNRATNSAFNGLYVYIGPGFIPVKL